MSAVPPRRSARQKNYLSTTDTSGAEDAPSRPARASSSRASRASRPPVDRQRRGPSLSRIVNLDIEVDFTPVNGNRRKRKSVKRHQIEELDEGQSDRSEITERAFRSRETPRLSRGREGSERARDVTPRVSMGGGKRRRVSRPSLGGIPFAKRIDLIAEVARDCLTKLLSGDEGVRSEQGNAAWNLLQSIRHQYLFVAPAPLFTDFRDLITSLPPDTEYDPLETSSALDGSNMCNLIWTILHPGEAQFMMPNQSADDSTPRPETSGGDERREHVQKRNELLFLAWKKFWLVMPKELRGNESALKLWLDFATLISRSWQCPTITPASAPDLSLPQIPAPTLHSLFSPSAISRYGQWSSSESDGWDSESSQLPDPQTERGAVSRRWRDLVHQRQKVLNGTASEVLIRQFNWSMFSAEVCAFIRLELDGVGTRSPTGGKRRTSRNSGGSVRNGDAAEYDEDEEDMTTAESALEEEAEMETQDQTAIQLEEFAEYARQMEADAREEMESRKHQPTVSPSKQSAALRPAVSDGNLEEFARYAEQLERETAEAVTAEGNLEEFARYAEELQRETAEAGPSRLETDGEDENEGLEMDDIFPSTQEMGGSRRKINRTEREGRLGESLMPRSSQNRQTEVEDEEEHEDMGIDDVFPSTQEMSGLRRGPKSSSAGPGPDRSAPTGVAPEVEVAVTVEQEEEVEEAEETQWGINDVMPSTQEMGKGRFGGKPKLPGPGAPQFDFNFRARQDDAVQLEWDSQPVTEVQTVTVPERQFAKRGGRKGSSSRAKKSQRQPSKSKSVSPPSLPQPDVQPEPAPEPEPDFQPSPASQKRDRQKSPRKARREFIPDHGVFSSSAEEEEEVLDDILLRDDTEMSLSPVDLRGGGEDEPDAVEPVNEAEGERTQEEEEGEEEDEEQQLRRAFTASQKGKGREVAPSSSLVLVRAPSYRHEDHNDFQPDMGGDDGYGVEYSAEREGEMEDIKPDLDDEGVARPKSKRQRGQEEEAYDGEMPDGDEDEEEEEAEDGDGSPSSQRQLALPSSQKRIPMSHRIQAAASSSRSRSNKRSRTTHRSNAFAEITLSEDEEDRELLHRRRASSSAGPSRRRQHSHTPSDYSGQTAPGHTPRGYERAPISHSPDEDEYGSDGEPEFIDEFMVDEDGSPLEPDDAFVCPANFKMTRSRLHGRVGNQSTGYTRLSGPRRWPKEEELFFYRNFQKVPLSQQYPYRVLWYMFGEYGTEHTLLQHNNPQHMKDKMDSMLKVRINNNLPIVGRARQYLPASDRRRQAFEAEWKVFKDEEQDERDAKVEKEEEEEEREEEERRKRKKEERKRKAEAWKAGPDGAGPVPPGEDVEGGEGVKAGDGAEVEEDEEDDSEEETKTKGTKTSAKVKKEKERAKKAKVKEKEKAEKEKEKAKEKAEKDKEVAESKKKTAQRNKEKRELAEKMKEDQHKIAMIKLKKEQKALKEALAREAEEAEAEGIDVDEVLAGRGAEEADGDEEDDTEVAAGAGDQEEAGPEGDDNVNNDDAADPAAPPTPSQNQSPPNAGRRSTRKAAIAASQRMSLRPTANSDSDSNPDPDVESEDQAETSAQGRVRNASASAGPEPRRSTRAASKKAVTPAITALVDRSRMMRRSNPSSSALPSPSQNTKGRKGGSDDEEGEEKSGSDGEDEEDPAAEEGEEGSDAEKDDGEGEEDEAALDNAGSPAPTAKPSTQAKSVSMMKRTASAVELRPLSTEPESGDESDGEADEGSEGEGEEDDEDEGDEAEKAVGNVEQEIEGDAVDEELGKEGDDEDEEPIFEETDAARKIRLALESLEKEQEETRRRVAIQQRVAKGGTPKR